MGGQPAPALDTREKAPHLLPARPGSTAASFRRCEWTRRNSVARPPIAGARERGQTLSPKLGEGFERFVCWRPAWDLAEGCEGLAWARIRGLPRWLRAHAEREEWSRGLLCE